jgi:hypothetical protein
MTKNEAIEFVRSHSDDEQLDIDDVESAFVALFDREPDDQDRNEGLWSHCCAAADSGRVDEQS